MYAAIRDSGRFRADYADAADCVCQLRSLHDYLTKGGRRKETWINARRLFLHILVRGSLCSQSEPPTRQLPVEWIS